MDLCDLAQVVAVRVFGLPAQVVDPTSIRAQQMVTAGQDAAGRAVVDSVLAMTADSAETIDFSAAGPKFIVNGAVLLLFASLDAISRRGSPTR